jgi:dihydropteroate synthase
MREKQKDESNINVIVPHARSQISYMKRNQEKGFELVDTIQAVEESFSNSARQMNEQLTIVKEKTGGFIPKAQRVHHCIDNMGNKGTKGANAHEVHRIKRECKIGLIRERSAYTNACGVHAP